MDPARPALRGLTLVEVLVAGAIMGILLTATLAIYLSGRGSQLKADAHTTAYRQAMLALEHLEQELKGAQLVNPIEGVEPASQATYRYPRLVDGHLEVAADGSPVWGGIVHLELDAQGRLVKRDASGPGSPRVLAELGNQGRITFQRRGGRLLRVTVTSAFTSPAGDVLRESRYEISQDFLLANQ